uniref:Uncharacterized protein n=1 Tax=Zeugodacus cucurbitae TaxID=28588 RepID=A0A0A1XIA8_ZEUCU
MRQILLNVWNIIPLFGAFNAILAICVSDGRSTIKEINHESEQMELEKAFTMERSIKFDSLKPVYVAKTNIRVKRSDTAQNRSRRLKSNSVATSKVNLKRRRNKLFVPVICG